jgi:hypothetical protein
MQFSVNANQTDEALVFPGLLDEVARSPLDTFDREIDVAPRGHDNHGEPWIDFLQTRKQIKSLFARSGVARVVQVDEQHIVVALPQGLQHQLRRAYAVHLKALRFKQ